jgi:3-phosphoshikimate 1-carboxyvinyltransferase
MKASISKSEICGKAAAPSSKSYTIRGLICAALADGKSEIISPLASDDTKAAINVLKKVGVNIRQQKPPGRWTAAISRRPPAIYSAVIPPPHCGS